MSKQKLFGAIGFSLLLLMGCNLAPVDSQSQVQVLQATGTPSHPVELSPSPNFANSWSEAVINHVREIFARGQILGNRADVFSKVGDSITVSRHFLYPFGEGRYDLGAYSHLQPVIDYYSQANARLGNSFVNASLVATEGWAAWAALSPTMADESTCAAGESPLACEYRLVRPSVAIIMFGTNDVGYRSARDYYADMSAIVAISLDRGVVPILSTIPNRPDVPEQVLQFNDVLRQIADENNLPLMDFYGESINLPNYGLTTDNVHPSAPSSAIGGASSFYPENFQYAYTVRNRLALEALYHFMLALNL